MHFPRDKVPISPLPAVRQKDVRGEVGGEGGEGKSGRVRRGSEKENPDVISPQRVTRVIVMCQSV